MIAVLFATLIGSSAVAGSGEVVQMRESATTCHHLRSAKP